MLGEAELLGSLCNAIVPRCRVWIYQRSIANGDRHTHCAEVKLVLHRDQSSNE